MIEDSLGVFTLELEFCWAKFELSSKFELGQLVDSDYLHLFAIWSKGNFWRWLFLEPRACDAWNRTDQNNSVIFN